MNLLDRIDFFQHLDETQRRYLASKALTRRYRAGEILFYAGEEARAFIFLLEGTLRLYKNDPKGNEYLLHRFTPVSPIAEMPTLEQYPYPASARFESDGLVLLIDYRDMKEAIERDAALAFALMGSLSQKIKGLEKLIETHLVLDTTARVAKLIAEDPEAFGRHKKQHLAAQLNMSPETFSRALKKLKSLNLIDTPVGGIAVLDEQGLRSLFEA